MGQGSYRASDWLKLKNSRKLSNQSTVSSVFENRTAKKEFISSSVPKRECRDSIDSPRATPVMIGFDVTASMGYLAKELALNSLNRTITLLLEKRPIHDPQILCAAVGDCKSDITPLQVTQFEADIRVIEQLLQLYLEGGGGGNNGESYNLLWYFASRHTSADCFEKRREKGWIFTIGDDRCHPTLTPPEINRTFSDSTAYVLSNEELLREANTKYNIFHIHISSGRTDDGSISADWHRLLPGSITEIDRKNIGYLAELIYSIISVSEGASPNTVLKGLDQSAAEIIAPSLAMINAGKIHTKNNNTISF